MNGKITAKRRQERSDHRLKVRLRTPGLVRPGAAMETRPAAHRYRGIKRTSHDVNLGGTAEGQAFRPILLGRRVFFCPKFRDSIIFYKEHQL